MPELATAVTVGGGLLGAGMSSSASKSAAGTAAAATDRATEAQLEMYRQTRQDMLPALEARDYALDKLIGAPVYETTGGTTGLAPMPDAPNAIGGVSAAAPANALVSTPFGEFPEGYPTNPYLAGRLAGTGVTPEVWSLAEQRGLDPRNLDQQQIEQLKSDTALSQQLQRVGAVPGTQATPTPERRMVGREGGLLEKGFQPGEFTESPGYQFMVSEADKAAKRRLAAQGLLGSGHALTEASRQGVGLASQDYWNWRQNALNEWLTTQLNPLQSIAGLGQTAAGQLGNIGYQTGAGIGSNIRAGGQAQALGRVAGAQAWQQGLQGVGNALAGADWSSWNQPKSVIDYNAIPQTVPSDYGWFD